MSLTAADINVTYGDQSGADVIAVDGIDLDIHEREFVMIIGPSGCGKSTLLHCLGGLLIPTSGTVASGDRAVTSPQPTNLSFVFQDYSLLPWKKVIDNVAIGLRLARIPKAVRHRKALDLLRLVDLEQFADSYPHQLSGGMQQRVAVARALIMDPQYLLMDEPFGALDELTRRHLGLEMSRILTEQQKAIVAVTHSLDEAIFWGDRVIVMSPRPGRIIAELRIDRPRPRSLQFIGESEFARIRQELFGLLEGQVPSGNGDDIAASNPIHRVASL